MSQIETLATIELHGNSRFSHPLQIIFARCLLPVARCRIYAIFLTYYDVYTKYSRTYGVFES